MVLSGLVDLLDDGDFLSSENLHDVFVLELLFLVLLAVALLLLVHDVLLAGLLAGLDDRSDLLDLVLLELDFLLEVFGLFDSDSLLLDEDESLLLTDSLQLLLFFSLPSPVGFFFLQSDQSELFFFLSSELLFDFLLSLDESHFSGDHGDVAPDDDQSLDHSSAESVASDAQQIDSGLSAELQALLSVLNQLGLLLLQHEEVGALVGGHDLVDLGSVLLDLVVPRLDLLLGARAWLVSDDELASLLALGHSVLESESVFSDFGESLGVLGGDELLSVDGDLESPVGDGLGGAAARLLHVSDGDHDSAGLLASGDSSVQDSDVGVGSVGGDD